MRDDMTEGRKFTRRKKATPTQQPDPVPPLDELRPGRARSKTGPQGEPADVEAIRRAAARARQERRAAEDAEAEAQLRAERTEAQRLAAEMAQQEAEALEAAKHRAAQEAEATKRLQAEQVKAQRQEIDAAQAKAQKLLDAERADAQRRAAERTRSAAAKAALQAAALYDPIDPPVEPRRALAPKAAPVEQPAAQAPRDELRESRDVARSWAHLRRVSLDEKHLVRNKIVTANREDPAHAAFDVLRTRLLQALRDNGWTRVAITSATKDCGKTFTAANLAISLSRQDNCRTVLMDFDLRNPSLHKVMGMQDPSSIGDVLRGRIPPEDHLRVPDQNKLHIGPTVAFGFNDKIESYAAELLQDDSTSEVLEDIEERLAPDVMLFDMPPALYHDDVIAFRQQFDGVLLVVGGGITTPREIREVERRIGADTPLLGTVLNKAEGTNIRKYTY